MFQALQQRAPVASLKTPNNIADVTFTLDAAERAAKRAGSALRSSELAKEVAVARQALVRLGLATTAMPLPSSWEEVPASLREWLRQVAKEAGSPTGTATTAAEAAPPAAPTKPEAEKLRPKKARPAEPESEYLSVPQAAQLAGVAEATIRAWMKRGEIPKYRAGRVFRVKRVDLETYLREGSKDRPPDPDEQAAKLLAKRRGKGRR